MILLDMFCVGLTTYFFIGYTNNNNNNKKWQSPAATLYLVRRKYGIQPDMSEVDIDVYIAVNSAIHPELFLIVHVVALALALCITCAVAIIFTHWQMRVALVNILASEVCN